MITADDKRRILKVDDDPDISSLYKLNLERVLVYAFNDPLLALSDYKVGDLLLIDIKMPRMNGFELYQKLKNTFTNMIPPKMTITIATYGVYDMIFDLKCISVHVWDNTLDTTEMLHAT